MNDSTSDNASYRWVILLAYILVVAMSQFLWINFAPITSTIEAEFHVTELDVGWLAMIFPLIYIFVSIPSGYVIDSKDYKMGVGLGVIFMTIFAFIRGLQHDFIYLLIGQFGVAIGQPFILNGVSKMSVEWFPADERELATGLGTMALFIGILLGMVLPPILIDAYGTMGMLWIISVVTIIIGVFYFLVTREKKVASGEEKIFEFKSGVLGLLKNRTFIILGTLVFIGMGAFNGIATWIEKILAEHGVGQLEAGLVGGGMVIGGIIGSAVLPAPIAKKKIEKVYLFFALLLSTPVFMILVLTGDFPVLISSTLYLGIIMIPALPIVIDWCTKIVGREYAGTSTSLVWLLGQIGGFIIPLAMELIKIAQGSFFYSMVFLVILYVVVAPLYS
ncbi:MAG: MFS transporter [Candidatus Njordarchaeia archaeon]